VRVEFISANVFLLLQRITTNIKIPLYVLMWFVSDLTL
jgi:hypothetical protein